MVLTWPNSEFHYIGFGAPWVMFSEGEVGPQLVDSLGGSVGLRPYMVGLVGSNEYLSGKSGLEVYTEGLSGDRG